MSTRKQNINNFDKTALMIHNIIEIGDNIRAIQTIIANQPKSYKVPSDYKEPENQVFFLDQKLETEVKNLTGKPTSVYDLIVHYLDWSRRALDLFSKNKNNLWNSALSRVLMNYYGYVFTVRKTLEQSFKNSDFDWQSLLDRSEPEG